MDEQITLKLKNLPRFNEKEYAQQQYDQALKNMLDNPSPETIKAFGVANAHLFEVQDLYRIALRLLLERAKKLANAVLNL